MLFFIERGDDYVKSMVSPLRFLYIVGRGGTVLVKKIFFRFLAIFMWLIAAAGFIVLIGFFVSSDDFYIPIILKIIVLLLTIGFVLLGKFLWRASSRIKKTHSKPETLNVGSFAQISVTSTRDIPNETLNDMKKHYSSIQLENDLGILEESVKLMIKTENISTFVSRYELAQRMSYTLEQAIMAGFKVNDKFISAKELLDIKVNELPRVLSSSYKKIKKDAAKLNTDNGKLRIYKEYIKLLIENEYNLDISANYLDIVEALEKDIIKLSDNNS